MPFSFHSLFFPWSFGFQVFHPSDHRSAKFPLLLSPCNVIYDLSCLALSPYPALESLFPGGCRSTFSFPIILLKWWVKTLALPIILFVDLSLARHYTFILVFPLFFGILLQSTQQLSHYCPLYNVL